MNLKNSDPKFNSSDKSNLIRIIKNNSRKLPKAKAPVIVKRNLKIVVLEPEKLNSKQKISQKMMCLKYGKIGHMANKKKKL